MDTHETQQEVAQRRVAEAEARVAAQTARIAELARLGFDTTQAQATLAVFEKTLQLMREDLAREQKRAAGNQQ